MKKSSRPETGGIVYSSEFGRMCPDCGKPLAGCRCNAGSGRKPDGIVRVGRETKGRKGKGVSVVTGVPATPSELAELAGELKKKCGCGGTVRDGVIEIQGDHRDLLVAELTRRGYTVKKAGG